MTDHSNSEPSIQLSYLQDLTLRLAAGASKLPPSICDQHASWIIKQQRSDGGFAGREGESDPYYTAFGLRSLWILDRLDHATAQAAGQFLRQKMEGKESVVDLISLIFAAAICELAAGVVVIDDDDSKWQANVSQMLCQLRTDDGGFAKTPEGRAGSTYQTFLSSLCFELLGSLPPEPEKILKFLESQAHPEGGFLEIRAAKRAGVNPTAAAIGTLKTLGCLKQFNTDLTVDFLSQMQSDEGGLTANTRIPFADLLSTCTGLITLTDLAANGYDSFADLSKDRMKSYAMSMQSPEGGFYGFALDQTADVEYTFYGLSTLALLA